MSQIQPLVEEIIHLRELLSQTNLQLRKEKEKNKKTPSCLIKMHFRLDRYDYTCSYRNIIQTVERFAFISAFFYKSFLSSSKTDVTIQFKLHSAYILYSEGPLITRSHSVSASRLATGCFYFLFYFFHPFFSANN